VKFGHSILRKIFKFFANRCQILRLKCTKFDFGWGFAPDPARSLQRSPNPLAGFKGLTFEGDKKWKGVGNGSGHEGQEWIEIMRKEKRRGRERKKGRPPKGWFTPHIRNPEKYPASHTTRVPVWCSHFSDVLLLVISISVFLSCFRLLSVLSLS